jgi:RNA polymerase sigma-70 factor, ECF subfamily
MMLARDPDSAGSDEALAERARRGERAAFVILVARYADRVYGWALRMSRNPSEAEEIAQETFLHAHRAMGTLRGTSRFRSWLYRIAINEALMRKRDAMRRPIESLDVALPRFADSGIASVEQQSVDDLVQGKAVASRVRSALQALDDDQRAALVLRALEELSVDDAAEVLGVSPEAVRQRAHRARLKLRGMLADLFADAP